MKIISYLIILLGVLVLSPNEAHAKIEKLTITNVSTGKVKFNPSKGEEVKIRYQLSREAKVALKIYDSLDILVRVLDGNQKKKSGDNEAVWDGKDDKGRIVPDEVYVYTIEAVNENGKKVIYDLTDLTGGKLQNAEGEIKRENKKSFISYALPKKSRVRIFLGLKDGGPLLCTLVDWLPRFSGPNKEYWDGWDDSHVINVKDSSKVEVGIWAYALTDNSIIIVGGKNNKRFLDFPKDRERRQKKKKARGDIFDHWLHPRESCRNLNIEIILPDKLKRNKEGLPIITGPTPIRMQVAEEDKKHAISERFEVVYYIDGIFVYENELGYTPFNWIWDPVGVNEGEHFITINLRGYQGHFGTASMKVMVKKK